MLHVGVSSRLCRLCGMEKSQGSDVYKDKIKGGVIISIINKYFPKEIINISATDAFSKYVCIDCEQKICVFDEFCLMVANVQKQLAAPSLDINFAEDMLCHLTMKENAPTEKNLPRKEKARNCVCPICAKSFRCQAHLDRHKLIHTGQRPFICNICRMSFNQREILVKHMGRHEGKRRYQCENCHQSFRFKVSLKSHMTNFHLDAEQTSLDGRHLHLENSSLTCSDCGKQFATKYKLQRHSRSHTGEKPFRCSFCPRYFSQTGNLKAHESRCQRITPGVSEIPEQTSNHETSQPTAFNSVYISESEIQKTINDTINSSDTGSSYLSKVYENPLYIDDEIETMLDQDLGQLEQNKYTSQDKVNLCLKEPETPELLHSLLYDD